MFAVLIAGRLVQTELHQIDSEKILFDLGDLSDAKHIVVFMTGQIPFATGFGGAVYLNLPSSTGEANWLLLGHLTNQKPSSIYRIAGIKRDISGTSSIFGESTIVPTAAQPHHAQLGISVEPLTTLVQQTPITGMTSTSPITLLEFCQKMLQSFYNYSSSFAFSSESMAQQGTSMGGFPSGQFVPLSTLDRWFQEFKAKLSRDQNFWKE